jgi:hypothetical protein
MAHSSVAPPSTFRSFYPHLSESYNDQGTSDITLCFGDNKEVYAHKVILKAVSGVWKQAFNSKLPISTQSTYDIEGHSDRVVYAMLRHVYGVILDPELHSMPDNDRIAYLFDVFAIANEYQIPSLGEAVTEQVVQLMRTYPIEAVRVGSSGYLDCAAHAQTREKFGSVVARTAELYINNNVADKSLMNGVLNRCFAQCSDIKWLEEHLHISSLIEKHDPFGGRLLRLYLSSKR